MRIVSEIGNIISSVTFLILLLPLMKNQFHIYLFSIFLDFFFLTNALLRFCVCFALLRLAYQHFTYFSERKTSKIVIKYTLWGGGGGGGLPIFRKKLMLLLLIWKGPSEIFYFFKKNLKNFCLRRVFCIFSLEIYVKKYIWMINNVFGWYKAIFFNKRLHITIFDSIKDS